MTSSQTRSQFKTVRNIFEQEYIIPEYQRGYAWEETHCEQLWDDLVAFENDLKKDKTNEKENYFLGTIILSKSKADQKSKDTFYVVDGQQRLITLLLLLRALQEVAEGHKVDLKNEKLKEIFSKKSSKEAPRIEFEAQKRKENNDKFQQILISGEEGATSDSRFKQNYQKLKTRITETDSKKLYALIEVILDKTDFFPIKFDSQSKALTVFETINDRGISLSDVDIFKAKIYTACSEQMEGKTKEEQQKEKKGLVKKWDDLEASDWLFMIYLRILRAEAEEELIHTKDIKDVGLRKFFLKTRKEIWHKYQRVLYHLEKLRHIDAGKYNAPISIKKWWWMVKFFNNKNMEYPLFVFLYKNFIEPQENNKPIEINIEEGSDIAIQFKELIQWTVRYCCIRSITEKRLTNDVMKTTYDVCRAIYHDEVYQKKYQKSLDKKSSDGITSHLEDFRKQIERGWVTKNYGKIVVMAAALNPDQNEEDFYNFIKEGRNVNIEHILPEAWSKYEKYGWNEESYRNNLWMLGNLVPCEAGINQAIQNNDFFSKKAIYKDSDIQDLKDLAESESNDWTPEDFEMRNAEIKERLINFFCEQVQGN